MLCHPSISRSLNVAIFEGYGWNMDGKIWYDIILELGYFLIRQVLWVKPPAWKERWVRTPLWPPSFKETKKNVSSPLRLLVKIQYCGEPPLPRGSVLGLRPPGLEFRLLVSGGQCHLIILRRFSWPSLAYVQKGGLKHHSFVWSRQTHVLSSVYESSGAAHRLYG